MKNAMVQIAKTQIQKETEKAINIAVDVICNGGVCERNIKMWIPKSQCVIEDAVVQIKQWIFEKKIQESAEYFRTNIIHVCGAELIEA